MVSKNIDNTVTLYLECSKYFLQESEIEKGIIYIGTVLFESLRKTDTKIDQYILIIDIKDY